MMPKAVFLQFADGREPIYMPEARIEVAESTEDARVEVTITRNDDT